MWFKIQKKRKDGGHENGASARGAAHTCLHFCCSSMGSIKEPDGERTWRPVSSSCHVDRPEERGDHDVLFFGTVFAFVFGNLEIFFSCFAAMSCVVGMPLPPTYFVSLLPQHSVSCFENMES